MRRPFLLLRRMLPLLSIAVIVIALYDVWIFYSRWRDARNAERARAAKERQEARETLDRLGGGGLKILSFSASPAVIRRGSHAILCFGVSGATSVRIEPPVEPLRPALSRCLEVSPSGDTTYKLIAEDGSGKTVTQSLAIKVVR